MSLVFLPDESSSDHSLSGNMLKKLFKWASLANFIEWWWLYMQPHIRDREELRPKFPCSSFHTFTSFPPWHSELTAPLKKNINLKK
jgi:hypothetical protein